MVFPIKTGLLDVATGCGFGKIVACAIFMSDVQPVVWSIPVMKNVSVTLTKVLFTSVPPMKNLCPSETGIPVILVLLFQMNVSAPISSIPTLPQVAELSGKV